MFEKLFNQDELSRLTEEEFSVLYNSAETQNFLTYIEVRLRFELIELIRLLDRKGEIFIEVRKKSAISAYNKLRTSLKEINISEPRSMTDIIKDFVGCRIICNDETAFVSSFRAILQSETFNIKSDGFELYSAPFRQFENKESRYKRLVKKLGLEGAVRAPEDLVKRTNYESLHCYITFSSPYDVYGQKYGGSSTRELDDARRYRYDAELKRIHDLSSDFSEAQLGLVQYFPIECQIRTVLEHLWAQEEHKFVYEKVKLGSFRIDRDRLDILKGAFTALKYAYSSIEELRDLIREVSSAKDSATFFAGSSKEITEERLVFFSGLEEVKGLLRKVDSDYQIATKEGITVGLKLLRDNYAPILNLYHKIKEIDIDEKVEMSEFNINKWGRDRLLYLIIAYMYLTSNIDTLEAMDENFIGESGLRELLGAVNVKIAQMNDYPGRLIASRIYNAVIAYDEFAYSIATKVSDDRKSVFSDPLVYARYASSLFLQERFSEARGALDHLLYSEQWKEFRGLLEDGKTELSHSELFMRRSQYAWFRSFSDTDSIIENVFHITRDFDNIFRPTVRVDHYVEKTFRAYCWFLFVYSYLQAENISLPTSYHEYKDHSLSYVLKFYPSITSGSEVLRKIETVAALISVADLSAIKPFDELGDGIELIQNNASYPVRAKRSILDMVTRIVSQHAEAVSPEAPTVFMSYSHNDNRFASRIMSLLIDAGANLLTDKDFSVGDSLLSGMQNAISRANFNIILVTPAYLKSTGWLAQEREMMFQRLSDGKTDVIVLAYEVTIDEILEKMPIFANRLILEIDEKKIQYQVHKIISRIFPATD